LVVADQVVLLEQYQIMDQIQFSVQLLQQAVVQEGVKIVHNMLEILVVLVAAEVSIHQVQQLQKD